MSPALSKIAATPYGIHRTQGNAKLINGAPDEQGGRSAQ